MGTCTRPDELRAVARRPPKPLDNLLCRPSAEAVQELAWAPRVIGARIGMVGVLHTWPRDLHYHPHVHDIVAGGGLAPDDPWRPARHAFLVPVKPWSVLSRAKFRDALQKPPLVPRVPEPVWHKDWGVHCEPVGRGQEAFRSLAPYLFRVAIRNNRILKLEEGSVTFQGKGSATAQGNICTVSAQEFIRRFLQHGLPDRCIKVRYDGWLSPGNRQLRTRPRQLLGAPASPPKLPTQARALKAPLAGPHCPHCGSTFILRHSLRPQGPWPP
jgi:Putative transposase